MSDAIKRIREALAAGPTPGPWSVETVPTSCGICHKVGPFPGKRPDYPPRHACLYADYPIPGNPADVELEANARYIAACSPANVRALLAAHDALKADAERLASLAWPEPFCDEYNGIDLHEQASIYASALGREEPNRDDYLAALRCAIDAAKEQK